MARITTRTKRKLGLASTHLKHRYYKGVPGKVGPRSFKSADAAKTWASEKKIDTAKFELRELQPAKFQWREKNPRFK